MPTRSATSSRRVAAKPFSAKIASAASSTAARVRSARERCGSGLRHGSKSTCAQVELSTETAYPGAPRAGGARRRVRRKGGEVPFRVRIDKNSCQSAGNCVDAAPEAFGFDDDGLGDAGPGRGSSRARVCSRSRGVARRSRSACSTRPATRSTRPRARSPHAVRNLLRDPRAAALDARERARRLPTHACAGRARRRARLPQLLDGRAPLPRGVLALLRAGRALRRRRRAHAPDPHRPRRAPAAVSVQPPDPRRRGRRRDRRDLGRPARVRHRALVDAHGARGASASIRSRRARCGTRRSR